MTKSNSTLLEVMQSRIGIAEIRGKKHNPMIVQWCKDAGHPEIIDDETSWCSLSLCSAAKEADLPFPPVNINPMAKSWLTWGIKVEPKSAVQPGDVAVWPRGDPKGWQGHVNVVERVIDDTVVCIGGNQSTGKGYDAVTRSAPRAIEQAIEFRRAVAPTIPALRQAGSTEVKQGDLVQNAGQAATIGSVILATVKEAIGPVDLPQFATLPESLTWWQTIIGGANAIGKLFLGNPWLAGTIFAGLICIVVGRRLKTRRLAKHKAGVPLSTQVVA